jgi:hypothetical protein
MISVMPEPAGDDCDSPAPLDPGEWAAIDKLTVFGCTVSPSSHLLDVPYTLRNNWSCAMVDVLELIDKAH